MSSTRPWRGVTSDTLEMRGDQIGQSGRILDVLLRGDVLVLYFRKGRFRLHKQGRSTYVRADENGAEGV